MRRIILVLIFFLMNTQLYGLKYEPPKGAKDTQETKVNTYKKEKIKEQIKIIKQDVKNERNLNGTNIRIRRR